MCLAGAMGIRRSTLAAQGRTQSVFGVERTFGGDIDES